MDTENTGVGVEDVNTEGVIVKVEVGTGGGGGCWRGRGLRE